jgi:restriction endonuclease Mrr
MSDAHLNQNALMETLLKVLANQKGPMSISEMSKQVSGILQIDTSIMPSRSERDKRNDFEYKLAWTRSRASDLGLISRVNRGNWQITDLGLKTAGVN